MSITFLRLKLSDWRQFSSIDLEFNSKLTVLAGENGAGKSSLLNILASHFGYNRAYLGTPKATKDGDFSYDSGIKKKEVDARSATGNPSQIQQIGTLLYSDRREMRLLVPVENHNQYGISLVPVQQDLRNYMIPPPQIVAMNSSNIQGFQGIHIPSHFRAINYEGINSIPTTPIRPEAALQKLKQISSQVYSGIMFGASQQGSVIQIKEALFSMAVFGEGNSTIRADSELWSFYLEFIEILRDVLPQSLGFKSISIRPPDVVMVTDTGEFLLDAASGGLSKIIEITWQLFLLSKSSKSFVVTMDEPENHLHPAMQRALLPNFLRVFPQAQFIVATHSPFIITASENASVFVLKRTDKVSQNASALQGFLPTDGEISSYGLNKLDLRSGTSDILRDVLDVPATVPLWVEKQVNDILKEYASRPFSPEAIAQFKNDLERLGFVDQFPQALSVLAKRWSDQSGVLGGNKDD